MMHTQGKSVKTLLYLKFMLTFSLGIFSILQTTQAKTSYIHANQPLSAWQPQVPDALVPVKNDMQGLLALTSNGVLTYPQPSKTVRINLVNKRNKPENVSRNVQFVSSAVVLNTSPSRVKAILTNYKNYPKIFPKLVTADVLAQKGNLARVKYRAVIDIPVPVLKFDEEFTLRHQVRDNSLTTWIEYSPVKYGMGQFQWRAINKGKDKGKTLLTLTHWGQLDDMRGVVLPQIVKAMPEIKLGIPNGVNGYVMEALRLHINGKDAPKTYHTANIQPDWRITSQGKPALKALLKNTQRLPVLYAHPPRKLKAETTLRFVSSLQSMPASQTAVSNWLLKPKNYPKLFKQVKKVTSTPHKNGELVNTHIRVGLGVIAIPFSTKIYFQTPQPHEAVLRGAGGDVRWIHGKFKVLKGQQSNKNKSYLMTTFASKTDKNAPFLLRIGDALPYNDYLGAVGVAPVLSYKVKQKLK